MKQLKRDSTEHEGSNKLSNDGKADPCERNYHGRLALILIKRGQKNLGLFALAFPLMSFSDSSRKGNAHAAVRGLIDINKNSAAEASSRHASHLLSRIQLPGSNV